MAIHQVAGAAGAQGAQAVESGAKESFGQVLKNSGAQRSEVSPTPVTPSQQTAVAHKTCAPEASGGVSHVSTAKHVDSVQAARAQTAAKAIDQVNHAQKQMDRVLAQAQSGKSFTPAELLALQAQVYQSSQELDLAGKVVDKVTGGVKQILTQQM